MPAFRRSVERSGGGVKGRRCRRQLVVASCRCRELGALPPPLRGRVGERGGGNGGVCRHPPPCPSPARGEGTLWPWPSQQGGRRLRMGRAAALLLLQQLRSLL